MAPSITASSRRGLFAPRPVFLVAAATAFVGLSIAIRPAASLLLLGSFPNSSLWRERYYGQQQQRQQQEPDYYDILGVHKTANQDDVKTAFRRLVKQYHPDANPNTDTTDQFQTINDAYQTLSDPQRRRKYNGQMYHRGCSHDTPNFIIDGLEDDFYPHVPTKTTATTDAVLYRSPSSTSTSSHNVQWEPNDNGTRGSLLNNNIYDENGTHGGSADDYRIRSY